MRRKRRKLSMNMIISLLLLAAFALAGFVIWCNMRGLYIQDTLLQMIYSLIIAELAACGGIKITNTINNRTDAYNDAQDAGADYPENYKQDENDEYDEYEAINDELERGETTADDIDALIRSYKGGYRG